MNDNFLYELRSPPPPQFAARLKARLDRQATTARQTRRSIKWFVFGAILMGGTALALVSPSVRQAAWTVIVQFRGGTVVERTAGATAREAAGDNRNEIDVRAQTKEPGQSAQPVARGSDGMQTSVAAQALETASAAASGPSATRAPVPITAGAPGRPTVRIRHVGSLQDLADNLAVDLERQFKLARVEMIAAPAEAGLCAVDPGAVNADLLLTDVRLSEGVRKQCMQRGRLFEIRFAYDALLLVVNRENTWARTVAVGDLQKLLDWNPANPVSSWSQLRSEWPTLPIALVGTSAQSLAARRFEDAVGVSPHPSPVFVSAHDDRATLSAIENGFGAIGYIQWRSLNAVRDQRALWPRVVAVADSNGEAIEPTMETISAGRYPLAHSIWLYADPRRLAHLEVGSAVRQLLNRSSALAIERSGLINVASTERDAALRELMKVNSFPTRN